MENNWWNNDIHKLFPFEFGTFLPPPPKFSKLTEDHIIPDGPTTCDLCSWAYDKPTWTSENSQESSSRDISWILLLLFVSLCSAIFGAVFMILTLKFGKRNGSSMALIIQKPSTEMNPQNKHDLKNNFDDGDMNFEDDIYATLDDRDSLSSENINSFNKTVYIRNDETDIPLFSSAPSSAYYSDLSHNEKAYENIIETYDMDKKDCGTSGSAFITINYNHQHNRLSAISENNNFGSHNNCNSDYV